MKKYFTQFTYTMMVLSLLIISLLAFAPRSFCQAFEDTNISVTSKLPPAYLGWKVVKGSTTQTVPWYYKVSAMIPGEGETVATTPITAYSTYGPLSSTNTLRIMWASVDRAADYYLYKSVNGSSYYFLTSVAAPALTYIDDGSITLATPYAAPSPRTGNISVENNATIGGSVTIEKNLTVNGTISPYSTGTFTSDNLTANYAVLAATAVFSNTSATALTVGGGVTAGTGAVGIVNATGKIPAISSTYFASLSGANLTAIAPANIAAGTMIITVKPYQNASCEGLTPAAEGEFCYDTSTHALSISTSTNAGGFAPLTY